MKKTLIVKNLTKALTICLCCVFCMGVLFSTALTVNAADEPSDDGGIAIITDLTGYTVTVPSGWTVPAGYGTFDFIGSIYNPYTLTDIVFNSTVDKFYIGFSWVGGDTIPSSTRVSCGRSDFRWSWTNENPLTICFLGGDTTNLSLIQWLYDNNATFEKLKQFYIDINGVVHTLNFEEGMTLGDWANSVYNVLGLTIVEGYFKLDNEYIYRQYVVTDIGESDNCSTNYEGLELRGGFAPASITITDGSTYLSSWGLTLFDECYATAYNEGYESGYGRGEYIGRQDGYEEGYLQGKTEGESSAIGSNLIGTGFTSITQALNQIVLYQSSSGTVVTLWVIISGAVGIALFIWILKLFAGG